MSENNNVIQFPGKKKETEDKTQKPATPKSPEAKPTVPAPPSNKKSSATIAGGVAAIILFTGAVNRYAFNAKVESLDASSTSGMSRAIASVEQVNWQRDATWEKKMAESLASSELRGVASTGIGHSATAEEKLRWGTLEEKYTIVFKRDVHVIDSISLQDTNTNPAYVLDRLQFLKDYGVLLDNGFASAQLKSVEVDHEKTIEAYTLYDKNQNAKVEARFELDTHKRLLSLKVEPAQI